MKQASTQSGFTLFEVMISIFMFSVIMVAASNIFAQSVQSYRYARASQQTMEDMQFAMNRVAKSLRTSSVQSVGTGGQNIVIYDYSREGGACIRYTFTTGSAILEEVNLLSYEDTDAISCSFGGGTTSATITKKPVAGQFSATASEYKDPHDSGDTGAVGRVTMVIVGEDSVGAAMHLQTSVSLRDYDQSGLL